MKTLIATSVLAALLASGVAMMAQGQNDDYLRLPGDNLNLYAVMSLFQESKTLEEFERSLNDENSRINNLDLNGDNLIDYINVFDNVNGDVHNIVMQVAVNKRERQDVAVFTVERDRKGNVMIQLTGDEALYGQNYIIEPVFDDSAYGQTPNPGYTGNAATINGRNISVVRTTTYEIATWPIISYIYLPGYVTWRSSWYWGYYPTYWNPWRPYYWHYYYGYHYNWYDHYYAHYRRWDHHRHNYWNDYYYHPHHSHSSFVTVNISKGHYKSTYSRPELKKKGEALYAETHRNTSSSRRLDNPIGENYGRRTYSSASAGRSSENATSSTSRRSENSTAVRSETRTSSERKSTSSARPPADNSGRKAEVSASGTRASESRSISQPGRAETKSRESNTKAASPQRSMPQKQVSKPRESSSKSAAPGRKITQSQVSKPRESSSARSSAPARTEAKSQPSKSRSGEAKSNGSQTRSKVSASQKGSSRR